MYDCLQGHTDSDLVYRALRVRGLGPGLSFGLTCAPALAPFGSCCCIGDLPKITVASATPREMLELRRGTIVDVVVRDQGSTPSQAFPKTSVGFRLPLDPTP